ncbi:MAG: hypothetical protein AAF907_11370 [Planctomycetota bacterium]
MNRRAALTTAAGASLAAAGAAHAADDEALTPDQRFVMAAGLTAGEADCWKKTADAAGAFFNLPELHPMDRQEVASAIHILQNKLLSRPTYRAYLKEAKADEA